MNKKSIVSKSQWASTVTLSGKKVVCREVVYRASNGKRYTEKEVLKADRYKIA